MLNRDKEFSRLFVVVDKHGPSQYTKNQGTVKIVDSVWRIEAKKAKVDQDHGFWYAHNIIHIDYLEKGKMITGVRILQRAVGPIRLRFEVKAVVSSEEKSSSPSAYKSIVAMAKFHEYTNYFLITIFSKFTTAPPSAQRLLFNSEYEEMG